MLQFLQAKFDNISLFIAMLLLAWMIVHFVHHTDNPTALTWAEQTFTTVLGAYIGLTQAARVAWKSQGGNGNGKTTDASTVNAVTPNPVH